MERRSVYKSFQIVGILFFILFFTSISVLTLQAQTTQKEEKIDITALSRKIEQLDERDYPDFASIFQKLVSMRFTEANKRIPASSPMNIFDEKISCNTAPVIHCPL